MQYPGLRRPLNEFSKGHGIGGHKSEGDGGSRLTFAPGWFCTGTKRDVPKDCCGYVGHYCGVYVWVPASGRGELSKLTLAVLDFAVYDPQPPEVATKEVVLYLHAAGTPGTSDNAVKMVTANVPIDTPVKTAAQVENLLLNSGGGAEFKFAPRPLTVAPSNQGILELRRRLQTIR